MAIQSANQETGGAVIETAEAEYMGISAGVQELLWIKQFISELFTIQDQETNTSTIPILYCDNQAAVSISHNDIHHHRTKHIDIKYHFIKQQIDEGKIMLTWISNEHQLADIFTKGLGANLFTRFRNKLMSTF